MIPKITSAAVVILMSLSCTSCMRDYGALAMENNLPVPPPEVPGSTLSMSGIISLRYRLLSGGTDCDYRMIYREVPYEEENGELLRNLLGIREKGLEVTIVKDNRVARLQRMLGGRFLGPETWEKLDANISIDIPVIGDALLTKVQELQTKGEDPMLMLDLGMSIEELEEKGKNKGITLLKADGDDEKLRLELYYRGTRKDIRWLLVTGSDHGVLPGSKGKSYDDQVSYMRSNYPDYEVGGARELVTLYVLNQLQTGGYLFPSEPYTYGRVKEKYAVVEGWKGWRIVLGSGGVEGLVVDDVNATRADAFSGLFACWVG